MVLNCPKWRQSCHHGHEAAGGRVGMQKDEPTRAQLMAAHLKADQDRLIEKGVLPPNIVRQTAKAADKETPEQREQRRAAIEKLRSFLD